MSTHSESTNRDRNRDAARSRTPSGWWAILRRTVAESQADAITDRAAALTYYGVLSIFPALIALVSVVGLVGQPATKPLLENVGAFTPGAARDILESAVNGLTHGRSSAGLLFFVGLAAALWAASGYIAAFMRASNVVWDVEEGRPITKTLPLRIGMTVLAVVLLAASAIAVAVTGGVAEKGGKLLGVGGTAVTVWDAAKWPVLVLIASLLFALLYYAAPNVRHPSFRAILPGGLVAVLLWIAASGVFAVYVAKFGSYNKTYGSLGAVIVFLVWLWISNIAILFGAELNAELARERSIAAGAPEDREPYLPPRDEPASH
jgi:membrane protein